jgi:hypothetical protein
VGFSAAREKWQRWNLWMGAWETPYQAHWHRGAATAPCCLARWMLASTRLTDRWAVLWGASGCARQAESVSCVPWSDLTRYGATPQAVCSTPIVLAGVYASWLIIPRCVWLLGGPRALQALRGAVVWCPRFNVVRAGALHPYDCATSAPRSDGHDRFWHHGQCDPNQVYLELLGSPVILLPGPCAMAARQSATVATAGNQGVALSVAELGALRTKPPKRGLSVVGCVGAVSPVLRLRSSGARCRPGFYLQLMHGDGEGVPLLRSQSKGSSCSGGAMAETVNVLFDGPVAAGWREFLPAPWCSEVPVSQGSDRRRVRLKVSGVSRTHLDPAQNGGLSHQVLVAGDNTVVSVVKESSAKDTGSTAHSRENTCRTEPPKQQADSTHDATRPICPELVSCVVRLRRYCGAGVWELSSVTCTGSADCGGTDRRVKYFRLYLDVWSAGSSSELGLRAGATIQLHNVHPVYGRPEILPACQTGNKHMLTGVGMSLYSSMHVLQCSATMDCSHRLPRSSAWIKHWSHLVRPHSHNTFVHM